MTIILLIESFVTVFVKQGYHDYIIGYHGYIIAGTITLMYTSLHVQVTYPHAGS